MSNIHGLSRGGGGGGGNPFDPPPGFQVYRGGDINTEGIKKCTDKTLDKHLKTFKQQLTVLHLYAPWCGASHKYSEELGQLAATFPGVQFVSIDVQKYPKTGEQYRVNSFPHALFLKKGSIEERLGSDKVSRTEGVITRLSPHAAMIAASASGQGGHKLGSTPSPAPEKPTAGGATGGPDPKLAMVTAMGFTEGQARAGLKAVGGVVENAINWILEHPDASEDAPATGGGGEALGGSPVSDGPHVHQARCDECKEQIVGSRFKCKDCKDYDLCPKCYKLRVVHHDEEHTFDEHTTELQVEQPSAKPKRVLTEEEKAQKVAQLKALMEQKRIRREEEERNQRRDEELRRRVEGKKKIQAKGNWEETKAQLERDKIKRQEIKDVEYKQKLLLKIRGERGGRQPKPPPTADSGEEKSSKKAKVYDSCTVQVRCKEVPNATWKGAPDAKLREVHNYLRSTGAYGDSFGLATTYPRKVYRGQELDSASVKDAGLVPRGVMMVDK